MACGGDDDSSNSLEVSESDFAGEWPLTVDSGTLSCRPGNHVIFTTGGRTYAVNGSARGTGQWQDLDPIWADNPAFADLKINVGDLIDEGLALCE